MMEGQHSGVSLASFAPPDESERQARTRLAAKYRAMANECRAVACQAISPAGREHHLKMVEYYEAKARRAAGELAREVQS